MSVSIHPAAFISPSAMIDPTAMVAEGAHLGAGVSIGPWCTVGPDVEIAEGAKLISHVVVDGHTSIGAGAELYPFCTVGMAPQDLKYKGEPTRCVIGARTQIREHCSIHRGTATGHGVTHVGEDCLLMAVVHVAHDCSIGDRVVIANNVVMGGHCQIGDFAVIGGSAALHQFVRIGRGAMVGGVSGVEADVIPFGLVIGNRARLKSLNLIGLKRRGAARADMHVLRQAVRGLFWAPGAFAGRLAEVKERFAGHPLVDEVLAFVEHGSKRGLIRALRRGAADLDDDV